MSMKIEKTENSNEVKLVFNVESEKFDEGMKKVYTKTAKYFNIPGFRKGKAPMSMVEKTYGTEIFYEDTFNEIVPEIFEEEVKKANLEVVSKPKIDIVQIGKGKELIFTAIIELKPEVKLGKYKGIELKKIEYNVSEGDIDHEIGHMVEKNSRLISVENDEVKEKDVVVIDFEGFVDGNPFEGGKAEKHELVIGSKTFIPGFEDQIVGMKIQEEKDINVKFPEEYFSKDLAGKDATFKVKLHEIKRKELPQIDDEFVKDVSEFDNLKDLKNSIKERLETENVNKAKYELEEEAIKTVCDNTNIDIPEGMIEAEIDNMLKDIEARLSYQGMNFEQYLKIVGKTEQELKKDYEESSKKSVKSRLILEAIVEEEAIKNSEEEVQEKMLEMAKNYGKDVEELKSNENFRNYIENSMKVEKAIKFIVENAKIK